MMKIKHTLIGALMGALAMTFSLTTASFAAEMTVKHVSGETKLTATPQKIVVFDLANLDNMTRLGINNVVAIAETPLPKYLAQYQDAKYVKVGTLFEPNYEAIANLKPDLIIMGGRSQPKYKELAAIAPTIDLTVDNNNYLADVDRNVTLLGQIFGKEAEAKSEIEKLNKTLAEVKAKAANQGKGLLILTTGGKMSAYGPGSRFGLLHSGFGVVPAAPDLTVSKHGQMISPEFILETNPDWLFVIDRDAAIGREGQAAAQLLDNALVNETKAAKNKHIVYLDPQNWYLIGGGLSGLHETAEQLIKAFDGAK